MKSIDCFIVKPFKERYDNKVTIDGKELITNASIEDYNTYFCDPSQIYMYQQGNTWYTNLEYCFVAPIKETSDFSLEKEQKHIGILKYGNKSLEELKIAPGDLIGYKPFGEFEFVIDGQRLYCMKSNDIVIKYEYKGNEKEYNPGWAKSS